MRTETLTARRSPLATIGVAIGDFFLRIAHRSPAARCAQEAERLFALSDADLARLGLTRDRVIQHAFKSYLM